MIMNSAPRKASGEGGTSIESIPLRNNTGAEVHYSFYYGKLIRSGYLQTGVTTDIPLYIDGISITKIVLQS